MLGLGLSLTNFGSKGGIADAADGVSLAAVLLSTYGPYGVVLDFADQSIAIADSGGTLNYTSKGRVLNGALVGPGAKVTYTAPSVKNCLQADGTIKYAAHNIFTQSADITNAAWSKLNLSASPSGTVGGFPSFLVQLGAGTVQKYLSQSAGTAVPGRNISWRVRAGSHALVQIAMNGDTNCYANFDLANGVVGTKGSSVGASTIASLGGGDYLITAQLDGATDGGSAILAAVDSTSAAWAANTSSTGNFYVAAPHARRTPSNPDYIATTSAPVYDLPYYYDTAGNCLGLLDEDQRTNLALYSQQFNNAAWRKIGTSAIASQSDPSGGSNAQLVTCSSGAGQHVVENLLAYSGTAGAVYTESVFIKSGTSRYFSIGFSSASANTAWAVFDLQSATVSKTTAIGATIAGSSIVPCGNGWFRISLSASVASGTTAFFDHAFSSSGTPSITSWSGPTFTASGTETVYLWQAQLELGPNASSPIVTYGSAVLRAADSQTAATTLFPSIATAGTLYFSGITPAGSGTQVIAQIDDGTDNNRYRLVRDASNAIRFIVTTGGVEVCNINTGTVANSTAFKVAAAWAANDFEACLNGGATVTDVTGTLPTVTTLRIGSSSAGEQMNGTEKQLALLPYRKAGSVLQTMTA